MVFSWWSWWRGPRGVASPRVRAAPGRRRRRRGSARRAQRRHRMPRRASAGWTRRPRQGRRTLASSLLSSPWLRRGRRFCVWTVYGSFDMVLCLGSFRERARGSVACSRVDCALRAKAAASARAAERAAPAVRAAAAAAAGVTGARAGELQSNDPPPPPPSLCPSRPPHWITHVSAASSSHDSLIATRWPRARTRPFLLLPLLPTQKPKPAVRCRRL